MSLSKLRFLAPFAVAVATLATVPACSAAKEAEAQGDCSFSAEGKAFVNAEADLEAVATSMKLTVATACRNIAISDGATTTTWDGKTAPTDDDVSSSCDAAVKVIGDLQAAASGSFSIAIGPASCEVNASAEASCTAECSGKAECMGGDITATCDPGSISGSCSGTCNVGATCDGSADVKVDCQGSCQGSCEGTVTGGCDGTCMGTCDGTCKGGTDSGGNCKGGCMGTCMGTCSAPSASAMCMGKCGGSCKVTQPNFMCSGSAKCTGGCSVMVTQPSCKGMVTPPSCDASASCKGNCQTSAQAKASCTPPTVTIVAEGMANANVVTALTAELPKLLLVAEVQGKALVSVLGSVGASFKGAVSSSAACAAKLEGFVSASASINVSFMASASASGKASAGG